MHIYWCLEGMVQKIGDYSKDCFIKVIWFYDKFNRTI